MPGKTAVAVDGPVRVSVPDCRSSRSTIRDPRTVHPRSFGMP